MWVCEDAPVTITIDRSRSRRPSGATVFLCPGTVPGRRGSRPVRDRLPFFVVTEDYDDLPRPRTPAFRPEQTRGVCRRGVTNTRTLFAPLRRTDGGSARDNPREGRRSTTEPPGDWLVRCANRTTPSGGMSLEGVDTLYRRPLCLRSEILPPADMPSSTPHPYPSSPESQSISGILRRATLEHIATSSGLATRSHGTSTPTPSPAYLRRSARG